MAARVWVAELAVASRALPHESGHGCSSVPGMGIFVCRPGTGISTRLTMARGAVEGPGIVRAAGGSVEAGCNVTPWIDRHGQASLRAAVRSGRDPGLCMASFEEHSVQRVRCANVHE
ncbi:uncharacterized protein B0I36DRAFT_336210 [Microdochium trichocladiopsis]|uniref:Uncharacterized protein n=1 Tax=Microdochium trichocladiopsis TaxID=1682393 RepID=A0A9P8XUE8_9PEZI|nr:uncharacterized protein B0I36DRAFT_336210 [Microdochium trichocladiopsis]KAH7018560.1 hypothetical protein B0I36DRAFT_336210 [Microdochium trichocladiopsis]